MPHKYSDEQKDFIKKNVVGRSTKELTKLVNEQFDLSLSERQLLTFKKNYGLKSGLTGQFVKGQHSWNKGMKGINFGGENGKKTQFKKRTKTT